MMPSTPGAGYRPYRFEFEGTLHPDGPWRVGSGVHYDVHTDMPLLLGQVEDRLEPYVPGSSIKGVLRDWLAHERGLLGVSHEAWLNLFGRASNGGAGGSSEGRLRVCDARPLSPVDLEIRDSVRIDRPSGAAAYAGKFDAEVAIRGGLRFGLVYEGDSADDQEMVLVREALRHLSAGVVLGGRGAVGYGRMRLDPEEQASDLRYRSFQRDDLSQLRLWLHHRTPGSSPSIDAVPFTSGLPAYQPSTGSTSPYLLIACHLEIVCEGPVLVKSATPPAPPAGDEHAPRPLDDPDRYFEEGLRQADATPLLTAAFEQNGGYYLPGSSLRGVARSIAERIPGRQDLTCRLFGIASESNNGHRGLVRFEDGPLALPTRLRHLDHVALCRVLGFPAGSAKFSAVALESPVFQNVIRVQVPCGQADCLEILRLVLRDFACGLPWVGSGTGRGYGKVVALRLRSCRVEGISSLNPCRDGRIPGFTWTDPPDRPGRRVGATTSRKAMLEMLGSFVMPEGDA